jgi:hypothetical protein
MSNASRFKELRLSDFVRIVDEGKVCQFEAFTVDLGDKLLISYGGTDDSIVGWQEDFQLLYLEEIEAHKHGREYLKQIFEKFNKEIIICGHSKGANIAMETLLSASDEIYEKISFVYCFDGPGLGEKIYDETYLKNRLSKLVAYIPYHSSIGRLFNHHENIKIVDSSAKFAYQHDLVNWIVSGNDFVYKENLSKDSNYVDDFIKKTLGDMSLKERELFVIAMFDLAYSTGSSTLKELNKNRLKLLRNFFKLPKEEKNILKEIIFRKMFKDTRMRRIILSSIRRN